MFEILFLGAMVVGLIAAAVLAVIAVGALAYAVLKEFLR